MTHPSDKHALRRAQLKARDALSPGDREAFSAKICSQLISLLSDCDEPIAGYWPIRSEVDVLPAMTYLAERDVVLALPRVISDTEITFHRWDLDPTNDIATGLDPSGFGTFAPPAAAPIIDPRTILIPLAAFDKSGNRLGYGKGYYDRALEKLRAIQTVKAIGVAFSIQEAAHISAEPHDQPLDRIVTEMGVIGSH